jgi:hypothetical protein
MFSGESFGLQVLGWMATIFIFVVGTPFFASIFSLWIEKRCRSIERNAHGYIAQLKI